MKKYQLAGFSNYTIYDNGTVKNNQTSKTLTQDKKKQVTMVASEDSGEGEGAIKKGETYKYATQVLMDYGTENNLWEDEVADINSEFSLSAGDETKPTAGAGSTEAPAQPTEADLKKKEIKDKRAAVKKAQDALVAEVTSATSNPDKVRELKAAFDTVKADLDALTATTSTTKAEDTPEQAEARKDYEAAKAEYEAAKEWMETLKAEAANFRAILVEKGGKVAGAGKGDSVPTRAPKLNYDKAQDLRRMWAETPGTDKEKMKACTEAFDVTPFAVKCIVTYVNYKLKDGDTAFTPVPAAAAAAPAATESAPAETPAA